MTLATMHEGRKPPTYANNITTNWQYFDQDVFGPINFRVKRRLTSGAQQDLNYTYDNVGNILSITDANFTANRTYLYDDLNRLISATGTFGPDQTQITQTFTYNAIGNLLDKGGTILSYNDPLHPSAVTSTSSGTSYSYDANGNMLTRGSQTLNWDVDNRVTSISVEGGGTTAMEYDYTGMRVRKDAPTGIMLFPFDGYEIDPNGIISKFIRIGRETFASKRGADKYFYHNDHLGSVNVITDINATRVQLVEYDPWGKVSRSEGNIDPTHCFTGKELDPETGLYYYGGRYYDAEIGRFISPDPFIQAPDDPQNLNRYSYVLNNPVNYIDPSGYFFKKLFKKLWKFTKKAWKGILHSAVGRIFISAVVGFATGFVLGPAGLGWLSSTWAIGAASGAAAGATMAGLSGGNPLLGALSGGAFGFVAGGGLSFGGPILAGSSPFLPFAAGSGGLSTQALVQIAGGAAQLAGFFVGEAHAADDEGGRPSTRPGGVTGTRIPQQPTGQLRDVFNNPKWFENWLRGNASASRIENPLTVNEARTLLQNAQRIDPNGIRLRIDTNPRGLEGREMTGAWAKIPRFKIGTVHIPVERGFTWP